MRMLRSGLSTLLTLSLVIGALALSRIADDSGAASSTTDAIPVAEEISDEDAEAAISPEVEVEQLDFDERADRTTGEGTPFSGETAPAAQELAPSDTKLFQMVGVTWDPGQTVDVEVRVKVRQDGQWSNWIDLGGLSDAGEQGGRPGTDPLWLDSPADGIEIEATAADGQTIEGLEATTIDPGEDPAEAPTHDESSSAFATAYAGATPAPPIISRAGWGAGAGGQCSAPVTAPKTLGVVMHHTAGANATPASQSASIIRGYQTYHITGQKWCDIGYNFLVDWHGQIFEGRKGGIHNQVRGAHAGNFDVNLHATGVAMMGNFESTEPPEAMKNSVVQLVAWKLSSNGVNPQGTYVAGGRTYNVINGHRDVVATACPGARGYAWLSAANGLRARVAATASAGKAQIDAEYQRRSSQLGSPTSGYLTLAGGAARAYQLGSIYWSVSGGARSVYGGIKTLYFARNGATGQMGFPISDIATYPVKSSGGTGQGQAFTHGSIFTWAKGTYDVNTPIRERWVSHWKGTGGALGWPTSRPARYAANGGGVGQAFENGSLFYTSNGVFAVKEPLRKSWVASGGVGGQHGWPISDETRYTPNGGGTGQAFQNASVFTTQGGTFWVTDRLRAWWVGNGGVAGRYGWPTSAMTCNNNACWQDFQGGQLQWRAADGVVRAIEGATRTAYRSAGGPTGQLGPAISNSGTYGPNSTGTGQAFTGGSIFVYAKGSFIVPEPLRPIWVALGGVTGSYGWPTSQATRYPANGGGTGQAFERGSVFTSAAGTFGVPQSIRTLWVNRGGVAGADGWPISAATQYSANGGGTGQAFKNASVFVSGSGTHAVSGAMRTLWVNQGGVASRYGWPKAAMKCQGSTCTQAFQGGTLSVRR